MLNMNWSESFYCAVCKEALEVKQMDELHNGNVDIFISPCSKCAAANANRWVQGA